MLVLVLVPQRLKLNQFWTHCLLFFPPCSDSVLGTELAVYPTKQTPIFTTKFTARNVLMCAGMLGI